MAKNYTLEKSHVTGWWRWECDGGPATGDQGAAPTKRDARKEARATCGTGFKVSPPDVPAEVVGGTLASFTVLNLDNQRVTFSSNEISQEAFLYFYGLQCDGEDSLTDADKAITILRIWGIYRGGRTEEDIRRLHYLSHPQFRQLVERQYNGLKINIKDDGAIVWKFPDRVRPKPPRRPPNTL